MIDTQRGNTEKVERLHKLVSFHADRRRGAAGGQQLGGGHVSRAL
jgi:hypothetical protein